MFIMNIPKCVDKRKKILKIGQHNFHVGFTMRNPYPTLSILGQNELAPTNTP